MAEFLGSPFVSVVVLMALTATAIAGGAYVIGRVRASTNRKEPPASEWLTNFKELHGKGELSDEEYRTIKAMLAERLQRGVKQYGRTTLVRVMRNKQTVRMRRNERGCKVRSRFSSRA